MKANITSPTSADLGASVPGPQSYPIVTGKPSPAPISAVDSVCVCAHCGVMPVMEELWNVESFAPRVSFSARFRSSYVESQVRGWDTSRVFAWSQRVKHPSLWSRKGYGPPPQTCVLRTSM